MEKAILYCLLSNGELKAGIDSLTYVPRDFSALNRVQDVLMLAGWGCVIAGVGPKFIQLHYYTPERVQLYRLPHSTPDLILSTEI